MRLCAFGAATAMAIVAACGSGDGPSGGLSVPESEVVAGERFEVEVDQDLALGPEYLLFQLVNGRRRATFALMPASAAAQPTWRKLENSFTLIPAMRLDVGRVDVLEMPAEAREGPAELCDQDENECVDLTIRAAR